MPDAPAVAHQMRRHEQVVVERQRETLFLRRGAEEGQHFLDRVFEVEGGGVNREPLRFDLRVVEDVVDDGKKRLARVADGLDVEPLFFGQGHVQQDVRHADDAVHGRTYLVAHVGEEGGLRAVRGFGLLARAFQRAFPPHRGGDVERQRHHVAVAGAAVDQAGELAVPEADRDGFDHGLAPAGEHPGAPVRPAFGPDVDQPLARLRSPEVPGS